MTLDSLLLIWRKSPNKELADAIVEIGKHEAVATRWEDIDGEPDAAQIDKLLDTILERGSVKARDRLAAMADWPLDPRIDRWVAAQYADPPLTSSGARPFWVRLLPLAKRIVDTSAAITILRARDKLDAEIPWQAFLAGHIDRVKTKLLSVADVSFANRTRTVIDDARRVMREQIAAARPDHVTDAKTLLASVYANPTDEASRIVLGDVLVEQGDPRGELIALQTGTGDPKREREIIKEHAAHLLGPLHAVLKDYTFERGFLARATIKAGNARSLESAIARVVGDPMWSTVEHLEGGTHELVMHPSMKSLRSLAHSKARLAELAKLPNLEALTTTYSDDAWLPLSDGLSFPALKELAVHLATGLAIRLVDSPLVTRLAKLDLRVDLSIHDPQATEEAFGMLRRLHRLHVPDITLRLVRYRDKDWHTAYHFTPGTVTITATPAKSMAENWQPYIRGDIDRATAILENLGREVVRHVDLRAYRVI